MSLWFVASAVLGDMAQEAEFSSLFGALLSSSVPAGFVVGALLAAFFSLADRFDPRRVFALSALVAVLANAGMLLFPVGHYAAVVLRFITGVMLAGVYPVGMKIAVGWGTRDRGLLVGLLVGGLTLGSAAPHLFAWLGGADWRSTTAISSLIAASSVVIILFTQLGPNHAAAPRFQPRAVLLAWTDRRIRYAFAGYFGHMWELYAMWAWIGTALGASYALQIEADSARELAKLTAFLAIGAGALTCPLAGYVADRIGKARMTMIAMLISGLSAAAMALVFGGPVWLVFVVAVVWGLSIIPDSAQFSALVADFAPADKAGSLLTLQTALGFALTILTVQVTPLLADAFGWPVVFAILAIGPAFGIWAMSTLTTDSLDNRT